jgi:DNA-binding transcriptional ArsR family regulator
LFATICSVFFVLEKATIWLHITIMTMDAVFRALADPSRRHLLDRLHARNGQTLNELCEDLDMTRQAVTKHLAILEEANLIVAIKRGREKLRYLNPVPINEIAERWIGKYEHGRLRALTQLKKNLEGKDNG